MPLAGGATVFSIAELNANERLNITLKVEPDKLMRGPKIGFDNKNQRFTGNNPAEANKYLQYDIHKEFAIPAKVRLEVALYPFFDTYKY